MLHRILLAAVGGSGAFTAPDRDLHALFNGQDGDAIYHIGAATRTAGAWSEYGSNPVITVGSGGAWDDASVKDPALVWDGSQYVCYFTGYDGTNRRIGRATATSHEGPWTKYASNPVLDVGSGGAFDDTAVYFPSVLYEPTDTGKEWKMWYAGDPTSSHGAGTIGYAHSTDGLSWTKFGEVVTKGAGGTWNDEGVAPGAVIKSGGTYYLFVQGRQGTTNPQWQGGLWTFTDPEGTYTADGGNPVMVNRSAEAPSLTLTADASGTSVTVADTTKLSVGEAVTVGDNDTTLEVFYVVSKTSTVFTVDHTITGPFTTAQGANIRPMSINSVAPRAVLARGSGGYEAFVSLFQPVEDLSWATKLFEGAFEMRSSALTGTWSYYYVAGRGLLFPLQIGASWHTRSAENPSVIAAP